MRSLKQDTTYGVKWSSIESFSVQGMQFLFGVIMARLLLPEDYGILGMIGIFIAVSQTFINCGFTSALIRKIDRSQEDSSTVFYFNVIVAILCYVVLFFSAPYIAFFFATPILCEVLRVLAINLVIDSLGAVHRTQLLIRIDFKRLALISLICCCLSSFFGLYLAYSGYGVWALVYQQILNAVLVTILSWFFSHWHPSFLFSWSSFRELFAFGSNLLVANLLHTVYNNITTIIVGKYYSAKDLGFYARGNNMAALPSGNIMAILQRVTFPIMAKIQDDQQYLLYVFEKYIRMSSLPIFFLMCLLAGISKPLVLILLTDKWADAVIYLQILCFALMFDHITGINMNLLQVNGRSDYVLKTEVIKKGISFAMILASIPFGIIAVCISRVLYTQIAVFLSCYYTDKAYGLSYKRQLRDFSPYFICAVVAMIPSLLLCSSDINPYLSLCVGGLANVLFFYILIRKDMVWLELQNMLISKLKNRNS